MTCHWELELSRLTVDGIIIGLVVFQVHVRGGSTPLDPGCLALHRVDGQRDVTGTGGRAGEAPEVQRGGHGEQRQGRHENRARHDDFVFKLSRFLLRDDRQHVS